MKHVLHSSLFPSSISICEQKLKYWAGKCKIQQFDNLIHNHLRYTMLYIRSRWIPTIFVVKTALVHLLPTLYAMCASTLYQDGVFSYLQCLWIIQECFEPRISFIICSNNIWQPFFALLKNCYAWTIAVFTTNSSIKLFEYTHVRISIRGTEGLHKCNPHVWKLIWVFSGASYSFHSMAEHKDVSCNLQWFISQFYMCHGTGAPHGEGASA